MDTFTPARIYYEPAVLKYPQGREILERYRDVPRQEIESHNRIPELRERPDKDFAHMKRYLILGIRKSMKLMSNPNSADFIVPFTSSGCSAMCLYCYLVCTYFKGAYLRLFVNRDEMIRSVRKKVEDTVRPLVFEIGSNSDLVMENLVSGNLRWIVDQFSKMKTTATFATKFHQVEDILGIKHAGNMRIRISVNPEMIIRRVELGTSPLRKRIEAANALYASGYQVGVNIAPIILIDDWENLYREMLETLRQDLHPELQKQMFFELIFMTYGYAHQQINPEAFPNAYPFFDRDKMRPKGRGKLCYKADERAPAEEWFSQMLPLMFPDAKISYIV